MNMFKDLAPAVKKETARVARITAICVVLMWVVFGILHAVMPEKVPLDYSVFLGGTGGGLVAVLNFLLMGASIQKAAAAADEDGARARIRLSYSRRMMMQMLWVIIAIVAPCFHFAAGILPLLFPSLGIKILTLTGKISTDQ